MTLYESHLGGCWLIKVIHNSLLFAPIPNIHCDFVKCQIYSKKMFNFFQVEAFCDVTLAVDGASIKCHKMVSSLT